MYSRGSAEPPTLEASPRCTTRGMVLSMTNIADDILTEFRSLIEIWEDSRAPFSSEQADRAIELARDLDRLASRGTPPADWHPRRAYVTR